MTTPDSTGDWLLLETLVEELAPTVVAEGARPRQWSGASWLNRRFGKTRAQLATAAVHRCRAERASVREEADGWRVLAEPVRCAFDGVHGVQVWTGTVDTPVPPRRRVGAWDWAADTELAHHGPGLEELIFARDPADVRVIRTPPDAFGRMVGFDGRVEYFAMATSLEPGGRWQGVVDMLGDDEVLRGFQMVARAAPLVRRVSGLMHALPEHGWEKPMSDPELAMLRAVSQRVGVGVGVIELSGGLVYEWVAEPPPPLAPWAVERPVVDPSDLAALLAACAEVAAVPAAARRLTLRVRFAGGDWISVTAELVSLGSAAAGHGLLRVWTDEPASG
ncbi:GAF domain-containing protein [Nocardia rhizosphaerae]|uniref:GAF domain-containing protein n=1 Tax=Nocardia rhizosphaerae TaxID=1691571 RepID=A0ABV8L4F4_9NOCA